MIRLPQRSVTRFFIPLIDVLTLLFCIFLILPAVANSEESADARAERDEKVLRLEREIERLRETQPELAARFDELRKANAQVLRDRLALRVLEVDPETGELFFRDPERVPVRSERDAQELVTRDRRERGGGGKELYYVILFPRDPKSSFPTEKQQRDYERWFAGVVLAFDIPGGDAGAGGRR